MHKHVCPEYPVKCIYCPMSMKRCHLKQHLTECGNQEIQCPVEGCKQKMLMKELNQHLIDYIGAHFLLQSLMIEKQNKQLEEQSYRIKELEEQNQILKNRLNGQVSIQQRAPRYRSRSRSVSKSRKFEGMKLKFTIKVDETNRDSCITKDFTAFGTGWWMEVYPNGITEDYRNYLSLFLYSKTVVNFPIRFTVTISSQKYTKSLKTTCENDMHKGWGWAKFCPLSSLMESKNEVTLTVNVAMKIPH